MEQEKFDYDVFLSYSWNDKEAVRVCATKLEGAGLKVWFDEPISPPGQAIALWPDSALDRSRTLVLFMSANALASNWTKLESGTLRFRDPLNKAKRFIPVRLDDVEPPDSLRENLFVDLRNPGDPDGFERLLDACRPPSEPSAESAKAVRRVQSTPGETYQLGVNARAIAFSASGEECLLASGIQLYKVSLERLRGSSRTAKVEPYLRLPHTVDFLAWDEGSDCVIAASAKQASVLDLTEEGQIRITLDFSKSRPLTSVCSLHGTVAIGLGDGSVRLSDADSGVAGKPFRGHSSPVTAICLFTSTLVSGGEDRTIRLWHAPTGRCIRVFEGHTGPIRHLAVTRNETLLVSGADDCTVRLWDLTSGMCLRIFHGHTAPVKRLVWSSEDRFFASAADDLTIRLWDSVTGGCLATLDGHRADVRELRWCTAGELLSADLSEVRRWRVDEVLRKAASSSLTDSQAASDSGDQVLYTNAKVLLVGESGAGKTGLSKRLALGVWELSASTVGAWATQWKLPVASGHQPIEREIWLWDFGGQADQRLIHQLYMDETSLVVLIFDGQKADVFDSLVQWDNDLRRASQTEFVKLLVAARVDASPLRISRTNIEAFRQDHGYRAFLETSALTGQGCEELKQAVIASIDWDRIPWRSSPRLFKLLKEEIVTLKDEGKILMRFNDLREMLVLKLHGRAGRFSDEQLKAVLSLLTGPGVISELDFGGWVLFQPQLINVYAQAVLRTMLEDKGELGCLLESDVLAGRLSFHDLERVPLDEEKFILLAMHHALLERGVCSREFTESGHLLVFPSYYKRQRPELRGHPAILVSYIFEGFVPEIYSTLVVRLHHTEAFARDKLWQDAADFKTRSGLQIGLKVTKRKDGTGLIEVYSDPAIPLGEKILFVRYVHEHLRQRGVNVQRRRHYVCPACSHPVAEVEAPANRLKRGLKDMGCLACDERIPLWDEIEEMYGSAKVTKEVQGLEDSVEVELDNESKERVLVGEVISAVALANQICREKNVSDHGIDAEIEFKDDSSQATGQMIFLQLKSGDSYLRNKSDGKEVFTIKKPRHAAYWIKQNCPVMLVIRSSDGEIRWMEIREYLREEYKERQKKAKEWGRLANDDEALPTQIEFQGEPFNTTSVLKWRARILRTNEKEKRGKPVAHRQ